MQNLDSVSHIVCMRARKGFQEILALWYKPRPPMKGVWLKLRNSYVLHLSYHAELGRCRSNRMSVSRGSKKLGSLPRPLRWGMSLSDP